MIKEEDVLLCDYLIKKNKEEIEFKENIRIEVKNLSNYIKKEILASYVGDFLDIKIPKIEDKGLVVFPIKNFKEYELNEMIKIELKNEDKPLIGELVKKDTKNATIKLMNFLENGEYSIEVFIKEKF